MFNIKHYPTHPGAEHPPTMMVQIPLEEYERLKGDIADLRDDRKSSIAIIDKLNAENKSALKAVSYWHDNYCELQKVVDRLQSKLECKQDKTRILKRASWLTRAERAHVTTLLWNVYCYQNNCLYFRDFMNVKCNPFRNLPKKTAMEWSDLWESIETKCLAKAEEYK